MRRGGSTWSSLACRRHASMLASCSSPRSLGRNRSWGRCCAKKTQCSPVPLAISRKVPVAGSTSLSTARIGSRLRATAGALRFASCLIVRSPSTEEARSQSKGNSLPTQDGARGPTRATTWRVERWRIEQEGADALPWSGSAMERLGSRVGPPPPTSVRSGTGTVPRRTVRSHPARTHLAIRVSGMVGPLIASEVSEVQVRDTDSGPWRSYKEKVSKLAERLVRAQQPIRVLDHIKWPAQVFESFRSSGWKELPRIGPEYYQKVPLGYDLEAKKAELREIEQDVARQLGSSDGIGRILAESASEYARVVELLEARGTPTFYELSRQLYGSARDVFADGLVTVRDVAHDFYEVLTQLDDTLLGPQPKRDIPATDAVELLNQRISSAFGENVVRVILDDGIVADAAAGSDYVKLRKGVWFSERDLRILEVHEGWAHVGTSLNGQRQPVARWLAKGPPRTAATQEGLAALLEILTMVSFPSRARRLNDRVL